MLNFKNKQTILGILVGVGIIYILSSLVIERRQYEMQSYLDTRIQEKNEDLRELALITARGEVVSIVEKIIPECESTDRMNFDTLLGSLDSGLSSAELEKLEQLFDRCGRVFASRRAAMALVLQQELDELKELHTLKAVIEEEESGSSNLAEWASLVEKEETIGSEFLSLVTIQEQIIKTLFSGKLSGSLEVENLRRQANTVQNNLANLTKEASTIRAILIKS